jgi:tetratricopeptide (TPR) repeat protein
MDNTFPRIFWGGVALGLCLPGLAVGFAGPGSEPLGAATRLFQEGKYAEAQAAFAALDNSEATARALGIARCQVATGEREKAIATLQEAAERDTQAAALPAELAYLALQRGDSPSADALSAKALRLDTQQVLAQWVRAELDCLRGKFDQAQAGYEVLVGRFNDGQIERVDELLIVGQAAAQYARWNRLSEQFGFLVNEYYPDLLAKDSTCWQAHYAAGQLFAEKYNLADAQKALQAALAINPSAGEVHVAAGQLALHQFEIAAAQAACDRALELHPQLLSAWHLKADIHLANFAPRPSAGVLADALKLNPNSEETLGRIAAAYWSMDGANRTGPDSRFGKLVAQVTARNAHPGVFYSALGDGLDRLRRWPAAAHYYQMAIEHMPQLVSARGQLGMVLMRLGDEPRAKTVLDEAFKADPFNIRVNNTLKVLEVLDTYETLESEHFRIKYDPQKDRLTAQYMSQWLEEVYPRLVQQMGFEPPEKSLFEVFNQARNTDGHGWFSARMVGLPHIHPIGACAGKIVALKSPNEGDQRFNWSRVLKHEFVHVLNLQQTDFNIPHWFTEALAVVNEGYDRPRQWDELLARRFQDNKLFDLESINLGFIRPHSSDDWTLAYCQAELYARYMTERFGAGAIARMLAAYGDNLTTPEALQRALRVSVPDFEQGYRHYVQKVVDGTPVTTEAERQPLSELQKDAVEHPEDPQRLALLAQAQLSRKNFPEARRWADMALDRDPKNALAHYVRARLHLLVGENQRALATLEQALDRTNPQPQVLALLAGLKFKAQDYTTAADLYEQGAKHDPRADKWLKSLAAVYLKSGEQVKLVPVLKQLVARDADDLPMRKKLAQLALAAGDFREAERWSLEGIRIYVLDPQLHRWRAEALAGLMRPAEAAREYAVCVELDAGALDVRLAQAKMHVQAGQTTEARAVLTELLRRDGEFDGARQLLESLESNK